MISYLSPGDDLSPAAWNAIFTAADARLTDALGGASAVLLGLDPLWDRYFFFFDPNSLPTDLHPVAAAYISGLSAGTTKRIYDDATIAGLLSGLSVSSTSTKYGVAVVAQPTLAAWKAALWPASTATSVPANWLTLSLKVHKVTVSAVDYLITFQDVTTAEHAQPFKPIDVFVNANLTWDAAWDKYSLLRVHNCATAAVTAFSTSIAPGASYCFRKVAGAWTACLNYFHTMVSGDARLLQMREASALTATGIEGIGPVIYSAAASIFMPGVVADLLAQVLGISASASSFGRAYSPAQFWDWSAIYHNASYTPAAPTPPAVSYERTPPSGGYFPAASSSTLLGDLLVHRGEVIVNNTTTSPVDGTTFDFTGFGSLASQIAGLPEFAHAVAIASGGTGYTVGNHVTAAGVDIIATVVSSGVITAATINSFPAFASAPPANPVAATGGTGAGATFNITYTRLLTRTVSQTDTSESPSPGTLSNMEIYAPAPYPGSWYLKDKTCPLVTFLKAGAVNQFTLGTTAPDTLLLPWLLFNAQDVQPTSHATDYAFQQYSLDGDGNPVLGEYSTVTVNRNGAGLPVTRNKIFLPTDAISAVTTWMQSITNGGGVLNLSAATITTTPFGPALTWIESHPLDPSLCVGGSYAASICIPQMVSSAFYTPTRIGQVVLNWDGFTLDVERLAYLADIGPGVLPVRTKVYPAHPGLWGAFVYTHPMLWNFARTEHAYVSVRTIYHDPADAPLMPSTSDISYGGWTHSGNYAFAKYAGSANNDELSSNEVTFIKSFYESTPIGVDTVLPVSPIPKPGYAFMKAWAPEQVITGVGPWTRNVLPCQIEHYNLLASLVNAQPPMRYLFAGAGGVPDYSPGAVPGGSCWPRSAFYSWLAPTSGTDTIEAFFTSVSCPVQNTLPDGYTATDSARYRFITIDDARILYAALSLPFHLNKLAVPMRWAVYTPDSESRFLCDAAGAWLGEVGGNGICVGDSPLAGPVQKWLSYPPYTAPSEFAPLGYISPYYTPVPVYPPDKLTWCWTALVILLEGEPDWCVAVIPQNVAYYDAAWCAANSDAYLRGAPCPIIADNSIESSAAEINIIPGSPRAGGTHDHFITTGLTNGQLFTIPIDGVTGTPPSPSTSAGNSSVGAGDSPSQDL